MGKRIKEKEKEKREKKHFEEKKYQKVWPHKDVSLFFTLYVLNVVRTAKDQQPNECKIASYTSYPNRKDRHVQ